MVFLFALSVVVDDLLDQRTGLQRRKRRCSSTARHLILGIGMSWACARAPRASCTGRGASETGHHVSGCADGHRSSQRLRESAVNTFFLFPAGPGAGPGVGAGWSSPAHLGSNWRLRWTAFRATQPPHGDRRSSCRHLQTPGRLCQTKVIKKIEHQAKRASTEPAVGDWNAEGTF